MGVTCEECRNPGACCRGITISRTFPPSMSREQVAAYMAEGMDPFTGIVNMQPLPMMRPLRVARWYCKRGARKPHAVGWMFECTNLTPEGRCGDYDNRPKLCHLYEPGHDLLCAEFEGSYRGRMWIEKT